MADVVSVVRTSDTVGNVRHVHVRQKGQSGLTIVTIKAEPLPTTTEGTWLSDLALSPSEKRALIVALVQSDE